MIFCLAKLSQTLDDRDDGTRKGHLLTCDGTAKDNYGLVIISPGIPVYFCVSLRYLAVLCVFKLN